MRSHIGLVAAGTFVPVIYRVMNPAAVIVFVVYGKFPLIILPEIF